MYLQPLLLEGVYPSTRLLVQSYEDLVSSRKSLTRSILLSRKEYDSRQKKLSQDIRKRVKDSDGKLVNPSETLDLRTSYTLSNQRNTEVLRTIQSLETDLMTLLNNRGIQVGFVDDYEEESVLTPK